MARVFKPLKAKLPPPTTVTVQSLSHDGEGVGHYNKKVVFVTGALPGEIVEIKFTSFAKGVYRAATQAIQHRSEGRVDPKCAFYGRCGGCDLMHLADSKQVEHKQATVLSQLEKGAELIPKDIDIPILSKPWRYRSKTRLALWRKGKRWRLGYRAKHSKDVVEIDDCLVLAEALAQLIQPLRAWLNTVDVSRDLGHFELFESDQAKVIMLRCGEPLAAQEKDSLVQLCREFQVDLWLKVGSGPASAILASPQVSYQYALPGLPGPIEFGPEDFTQINRTVNRSMVGKAKRWLQEVNQNKPFRGLLDLFCGVGNFTLPLSSIADFVTGIELHPDMVGQGKINALNNGIKNAYFVGLDLHSGQDSFGVDFERYDAVLLDPPRAGAFEILVRLVEYRIPWLLYVSCNPSTLIRDAAMLAGRGYRLERFCVLDMFPHTRHIETMVLFRLAEIDR